MTLGITFSLTYYALTTTTDFTVYGGVLFVLGMGLMLFGLGAYFVGAKHGIVNILYCTAGVIVYGFYLIYDIQLIAGGKTHEYTYDDYVIASVQIYLDIIIMFLKILEILNEIFGKKD